MFFGLRLVTRIIGAVFAIVLLYLAFNFVQVWWASNQGDQEPSAAIVVMGAAQWNGVPSPVLRRRLDHATELYNNKVAPYVIVTGGKQVGDKVTQGYSGYEYLRSKGVPESAIKVEVEGTNSYEELSASAVIVRSLGDNRNVVIVTDPYHAYRVDKIAHEVGLRPHVSPTSGGATMSQYVRETLAVSLGRIVSFRRLASWR